MTKRHAAEVAYLHQHAISTGFLSSLGPMFLRQVYKAIPSCPAGFGFVGEGDNGQVLGFVAAAESTGRVYKQALARRGVLMALPLAKFMFRPSVIKRVIQTLRYPSDVGEELPPAEILSIVVSDQARGDGLGRELMAAALEEFSRRGISRAKVAVWTENEGANAFYRRCGFSLAMERKHHGLGMNIYTIDISG